MKVRVMMDKKSIPDELDVFISLLGEIDMIKNQLSMLDKNTHITLSQNNVSALLGNAECFRVLKIVENLNANLSELNAALLHAAEIVSIQHTQPISDTTAEEPSKTSSEESSEESISPPQEKENLQRTSDDNKTINNMLQYFKERFEGNDPN
jgi:formate dehydrogenase maturation protein FdhE